MTLPWLDPVKAELNDRLDAGRLGHAPLIHGPAGSGKRVLADWLARRMLCATPAHGEPCRACASCRLMDAGTHPDHFGLHIAEDKSEILVDQTREFCNRLALTASRGGNRVGRIDPVETMNRNAANALLKTLEEPSDNAWLILITDRPERLPATVRSRCQRVRVSIPARSDALAWLESRDSRHGAAERELALHFAGGAPLVAAGWLADGGLDAGRAIGAHLLGLLSGKATQPAPVEEWAGDPGPVWDWLGRWTAELMQWRLTGASRAIEDPASGSGVRPPERDAASLPNLEQCWRGALQGKRLAARPVRHDLLFRRWLLHFAGAGVTIK